MFTESLLDSASSSSSSKARRWPKLLSFALQALGAGLLILAPLFRTYAVPALVEINQLLAPPVGAPPRPAEPRPGNSNAAPSQVSGHSVMMYHHVPEKAAVIHDEPASAAPPPMGFYVADAIPGGDQRKSMIEDLVAHVTPPPRSAPPTRARLSEGVLQGYLIQKVQPGYPALAMAAHIQGPVVLMAVINRSGEIENLRVVSGHPMLAPAALNAVRQWRYQPYRLNGEPVEVETQITVNFVLAK